ncbi:MAG: hypothetical protein DRQ42_00125 [Gammaproteobacteria bacterium]|nr:MAG: hypothetical protein DRQ42_00125 [Gammaproteobacteria bacterium]
MTNKVSVWIGIIVAFFTIIGGLYAYDLRKADKAYVDLVAMRIDQKILNDQIFALERQIFDIRMNAQKLRIPLTPTDKRFIMQIEHQIRVLRQQLKGGS